MGKVTLQSQEWRTEDEQGNEEFGETLFINGNPVDKEKYGDMVIEMAKSIVKALGFQVEVLPDMEPMEMAAQV